MFKKFIVDMDNNIEEYRKFLWRKTAKKLTEMCREKGIKGYSGKLKRRIIDLLISHKLNEKKEIRKKYNSSFDFDELLGIKDLLPKE